MNDIFKVMKFTMKDMIRKKSFIVATIIILLMIVIGFNIPRIIKSFKTNENTKLLIVDKDKLFNGKLYTLDKILEDYDIKVSYEDTEDMVKEKINNEEIDMGIFLCFLELCLEHNDLSYERELFVEENHDKN